MTCCGSWASPEASWKRDWRREENGRTDAARKAAQPWAQIQSFLCWGRAGSTGRARELGFFGRCNPNLRRCSVPQSKSLARGEKHTPEFTPGVFPPCVLDHHLHTCPPFHLLWFYSNPLLSHKNLMSLNPQLLNVTGEGNLQGLPGLLPSSPGGGSCSKKVSNLPKGTKIHGIAKPEA